MRELTTLTTEQLSVQELYKLMTGLIIPRPIGWIGTYGADRTPNLAPYSFFQCIATNPPVVLFSTGVNTGHDGQPNIKDSLANARSSGCFTTNIVDHDLSVAMNATSAAVPSEVDEFGLAGLTATEFGHVDAPGVAEAKAVLECRVVNEMVLGNEPLTHAVTFGEVIAFHIDDSVLDGTRVKAEELDALGRLAGTMYTTTREQFSMQKPD